MKSTWFVPKEEELKKALDWLVMHRETSGLVTFVDKERDPNWVRAWLRDLEETKYQKMFNALRRAVDGAGLNFLDWQILGTLEVELTIHWGYAVTSRKESEQRHLDWVMPFRIQYPTPTGIAIT